MNLPFPGQHKVMLSALFCAGLAWNGGTAEAAGLGTIQIKSALGEPFRAEIPLLNSSERMASGCVKLVDPGADEDIPSLRHASVRVVRSEEGTRLLIMGQQPTWEPILRVHVRVGCGIEIQREYNVMLDVGDDVKASPKKPERGRADHRAKVASDVEPPQQAADMGAPVSAQRKNDSSLTSRGRRHVRKHSGAEVLPLQATSTLDSHRPKETKQESQSDRLVIAGGDGIALRMSDALSSPIPPDSASDNHRQMVRKGLQALADLQKMEAEVTEALDAESAGRPLSASQMKALSGGGDRLVLGGEEGADNRAALPVAAPAPKPTSASLPSSGVSHPEHAEGTNIWLWGGVLTGLLALLGAGWWFIGRRRRVLPWPDNVTSESDNKFDGDGWDEDWSEGGGKDFIQANRVAEASGQRLEKPPIVEEAPVTSLAVDSPSSPEPKDAVETAPNDPVEPVHQTPPAAKESSGVVLTEGGAIPNQLEDLLEVVSVFQAFGRPKAAVDVLEEFLLEKPREGTQPWIRLLALLKELDRREEFCAWAQRYQDAFGGELESWPGEDDAKEEITLNESIFAEDGAEDETTSETPAPAPMAEELPPLEFYLPPAEPEAKESDH